MLVHPYSDLLPGTESIILGMFTYNQMKKHKQGKSRAPVCKRSISVVLTRSPIRYTLPSPWGEPDAAGASAASPSSSLWQPLKESGLPSLWKAARGPSCFEGPPAWLSSPSLPRRPATEVRSHSSSPGPSPGVLTPRDLPLLPRSPSAGTHAAGFL